MTELVLTQDQDNAFKAFTTFLADPKESVFVLEGYSGTGKSTLVSTLLDKIPNLLKTIKLVNPSIPEYEVELTATTNKAAENLSQITGQQARTIHSTLGLRVSTDYKTNKTTLIPRTKDKLEEKLLFIDEASYIDSTLLHWIFSCTERCKIVFMGDPAQLTPVQSSSTPVFKANFNGAKLTEVVRQAKGNPIMELSTKFRETVKSGEFFSFTPDGHHIQYLDRESFNTKAIEEFTRTDWNYADSKILGWTNKCVISYNSMINNNLKGSPYFLVNDYVVCNNFISGKNFSFKTDQMVRITGISDDVIELGVPGNYFTLDGVAKLFAPKSLELRKLAIKNAKTEEDEYGLMTIAQKWVDLRAAYACTINKSQGSTFKKVFIDLDDIKRCNSGDQIARMMYVGVSRARHQVFLTGDLV